MESFTEEIMFSVSFPFTTEVKIKLFPSFSLTEHHSTETLQPLSFRLRDISPAFSNIGVCNYKFRANNILTLMGSLQPRKGLF